MSLTDPNVLNPSEQARTEILFESWRPWLEAKARERPMAEEGISHRYCRVLQRADGDSYSFNPSTNTEDATRAA
ncbi:MAG: hypothetical protein EOM91_12180 [Sphingobacteriia bacterium]|jgi:hypothetical protein|nr:hypothetical protein [Sphingobacteriia bacterium]